MTDVIHLTTDEVAKRYQTHPVTIKKWRIEGRGPRFIKIGRRVLYPIQELMKWESEHLLKNTAQAHIQEARFQEQI